MKAKIMEFILFGFILSVIIFAVVLKEVVPLVNNSRNAQEKICNYTKISDCGGDAGCEEFRNRFIKNPNPSAFFCDYNKKSIIVEYIEGSFMYIVNRSVLRSYFLDSYIIKGVIILLFPVLLSTLIGFYVVRDKK